MRFAILSLDSIVLQSFIRGTLASNVHEAFPEMVETPEARPLLPTMAFEMDVAGGSDNESPSGRGSSGGEEGAAQGASSRGERQERPRVTTAPQMGPIDQNGDPDWPAVYQWLGRLRPNSPPVPSPA